MCGPDTAEQELVEELASLRQRVAELEAALDRSRRAEEEQRRIRDRLPVLVAVAGFDGFYREVNESFERILGWSEAESLARPFVEFIHPEDRPTAAATFARLQAGELVHDFVDRNVCKDGSHRWLNWSVIPLLDRGIVYGIGQDITARRQAELDLHRARVELEQRVREQTADLRHSNEQLRVFRTFAEASAQGFGMADMEGRIVYVNPALARLLGESRPEDAYGQHPARYYSDDYRHRQESEIFPEVARDGFWQGELTIRSGNGEQVPVLQSSFTVAGDDGEPVRRGVVITDLREIKRTQRALQAERDALYRMLQASDRDRELFTREVHDHVTQRVLGALFHFSAASQACCGARSAASDSFRAGLAALQEAAAESRRLLNRTRTPVLRRFGLGAAVADFIDQFDQPDVPEIVYGCERLCQRLAPVLENAIYRVAQEAITNACLHSHARLVRVALRQLGDQLVLEVQDDGIGFDPAAEKEGCFGLDGIREWTRLFGTELCIDSAPGRGTRIRAAFPLILGVVAQP